MVRNNNGIWEIVLIYKKWSEDNQGWVPPKGHVEEGESLEEAAVRETKEETGYKNMEIIKPLETLEIEYPWADGYLHKKSIHYFLAKLINDEKTDLKLSDQEENSTKEIKWMLLEEAEKNLKFDDERRLLQGIIFHPA